jgi:hypothetical protein
VDAPEVENIGFPEIDHQYQFMGAAHLSGTPIVSSEVGGGDGGAYSQSVPSLLRIFSDAFAAGVNLMQVHGAGFSGEYFSSWPGYTPLYFMFADVWNDRQPAWKYLDDSMRYAARNQLVLQTGSAKKDIAFYFYRDPWNATTIYEGGDLRAKGKIHDRNHSYEHGWLTWHRLYP